MIVELMFKDPDCSCSYEGNEVSLTELPQAEQDKLAKFVEWSEYVTLRFDTAKGTAEVMPV